MPEKPSAFDVIVAQMVALGVDPVAARVMAENALNGKTTLVDQGQLPNGTSVISVEDKAGGIDIGKE